jgi:hypothetical protein
MAMLISKKTIIIIVSIILSLSVGVGVFLVVKSQSDSEKSGKDKESKKQETTEIAGENVNNNVLLEGNGGLPSKVDDANDTDKATDSTEAHKEENDDTTAPKADDVVVEKPDSNVGGSQNKPTVVEPEIPDSTSEIVEYYKKSVNYAKTNGKSAVLVKDGVLNYNNIVRAGELTSAAESLIGMFMVASESEISPLNESRSVSTLPPSGMNCNLTASGVKSASITDNGDTYTVVIVAKDCENPTPGSDGVGSLINVVESSQITGAIGSVPGLALSNINIDYENVTVTAVIDKATGGLLSMKINAPSILSLDAKLALISADDCMVGIQCITEYNVKY